MVKYYQRVVFLDLKKDDFLKTFGEQGRLVWRDYCQIIAYDIPVLHEQ